MKILTKHYPTQRPLTPHEQAHRLYPKKDVNIDSRVQLSAVQLNSTFLECVDFYYNNCGAGAFLGLSITSIFTSALITTYYLIIRNWHTHTSEEKTSALLASAFITGIALAALYVGVKLLRFDAFRLTHYPIRFNRKNRMVYAFRPDGSVFSAPWDSLYVVHHNIPGPVGWHIRAHVLDEKGLVQDTLAIPNPIGTSESALEQWEFIRRYMEQGPDQVQDLTDYFMPLWDRKESPLFSFLRLNANYAGNPVAKIFMFPITLIFTLGRVFAMLTNKIPTWPAEVEAECHVESGDPYIKDWRSNTENLPFFW